MSRVSDLFHWVFNGQSKAHFWRICSSSIWDLKVCAYYFFKVTTSDHSHTHWASGFKLPSSSYISSVLDSNLEVLELEVHIAAIHY